MNKSLGYSYRSIPDDISQQLDSIRGLSAIVVLIAHAQQIFLASITTKFYAVSGLVAQAAVMVFFVLSGLLIGKSITKQPPEDFNRKKYFINRFNRIYPPLLFSFLIVLILYALAPYAFPSGTHHFLNHYPLSRNGLMLDIPSLLCSAVFLNGFTCNTVDSNGPLWSLSYEVWFYILIACIYGYKRKLNLILFSVGIIFLGFFSKVFVILFFVWLAGFFLGIVHNKNKDFHKIIKWMTVLTLMASFLFAVLYVINFHYSENISIPFFNKNISLVFFQFSIGMFTSCLFYKILNGEICFPTLFKNTSQFSYTLYIIHFPIFLFIFGVFEVYIIRNLASNLIVSALSCVALIIFSRIIARFVENIKILKF